MRYAPAYLLALLASTAYVCATPTWKDEFKLVSDLFVCRDVPRVHHANTRRNSVNKIHLWGEHAVKDAEQAVSTAFYTVQNSEPVKEIVEFRDAVQAMVDSVSEMHKTVNSNLQKRGAVPIDLNEVSTKLAEKVDDIIQQIMSEFSEPRPEDKTESYKAVEQAVVFTLDKIEDAIVAVYGSLGIPESEAREIFGHVKPHIKDVVLVLYKLVEEHPIIVGTLMMTALTMILPEDFFLRSIMQIFGWGTKGPIRGSVASWAQRIFFPAAIPKGSWFSQLQKIGMAKL